MQKLTFDLRKAQQCCDSNNYASSNSMKTIQKILKQSWLDLCKENEEKINVLLCSAN